jgi:putative sigma-54 modulation protein
MNLNMSFKHMGSSEAIKTYTTEKSEKLAKYFNGKISVTWNFSAEKQLRSAHCHLVGNNMDYFGEAETEDLHASIDLALEKIEKQVRKHKEIVKDHLHKHARAAADVTPDSQSDQE